MSDTNTISDIIHFKVEEKLYQEFKVFHLNFLEETQYFEIEDIKNFFIFLINEWYDFLNETETFEQVDSEKIAQVNRKGKRYHILPYEGNTTRISFYFRNEVREKWNKIIYHLMKKELFSQMKIYTNGYFFPYLFDFAKENKDNLIKKYKKVILTDVNLKKNERITIRFLNKSTIKNIEGKILNIEDTPNGLVIHIDRVNL